MFNNRLGRKDQRPTPLAYNNLVCVSCWLQRWDVCSWAVLVLGEVPSRQIKCCGWKDAGPQPLCGCGMLQGITRAGPRATLGEEMGTAACAGLTPPALP